MVKVAFYTIAKDEAKHVQRWCKSTDGADYRLILDTGSLDNTIDLAKQAGVVVYTQKFMPFRFDTARQTALDLLPPDIDYCVSMDMDETIAPGWREELVKAHETNATRVLHRLQLSRSQNILRDRIHARRGYVWKDPIHEYLDPQIEESRYVSNIQIYHKPDSRKSREHYLWMLQDAVAKDPYNPRLSFFLYRQYLAHGRNRHAAEEWARFIEFGGDKMLDFYRIHGKPINIKLPEELDN